MKRILANLTLGLFLCCFLMPSVMANERQLYLVSSSYLKKEASDRGVWIIEVEVREGIKTVENGIEVTATIKADKGSEKIPFQLSNPDNKAYTLKNGRAQFFFQNLGIEGKGIVTFTTLPSEITVATRKQKLEALKGGKPDPKKATSDSGVVPTLTVEVSGSSTPLNAINALTSFISFVLIMFLLSAGVEKLTELFKVFHVAYYGATPPTVKDLLQAKSDGQESLPYFLFEEIDKLRDLNTILKLEAVAFLKKPLDNLEDNWRANQYRNLSDQASVAAKRMTETLVNASKETKLVETVAEERTKLILEIAEEDRKRRNLQNRRTSLWRLVSLVLALILILPARKWLDAGILMRPILDALGGIAYKPNYYGAAITAFGAAVGSQFWHDFLESLVKTKDKVQPPQINLA